MANSFSLTSFFSRTAGRKSALIAMGMVLFFSKLFMIHRYASQCPFWDQWDAEGDGLYLRHLQGSLTLENLFAFHNEHRIFFIRVMSLVVFDIAGQWDSMSSMIVNSAVHVSALMLFVHISTRCLSSFAAVAAILSFTLFLVIPFGWETLLLGFQQFNLQILFGALSLGLCLASPVFSIRWAMGMLLGVCSFFNLASGVMVFAVIAGLSAVRLVIGSEDRRLSAVECLVSLAIFAYLTSSIPRFEHHAALKAHSIEDFIRASSLILSWPLKESLWHAFVIWSPTILLAIHLLRKGMPRNDKAILTLSLSTWVFFSDLAFAYGRANPGLASRYLDLVSLEVLTNSAAAWILFERMKRGRLRVFVSIAMPVFFCWIGYGSVRASGQSLDGLRWREEIGRRNEENVKGYILTGDISFFSGKKPFEVPYPDSSRLAHLLDMPEIRGMLPPEFGNSEEERRMVREKTLTKGRLSGFASYVKETLLKTSPFLLCASAFWYLLVLHRFFRSIWRSRDA